MPWHAAPRRVHKKLSPVFPNCSSLRSCAGTLNNFPPRRPAGSRPCATRRWHGRSQPCTRGRRIRGRPKRWRRRRVCRAQRLRNDSPAPWVCLPSATLLNGGCCWQANVCANRPRPLLKSPRPLAMNPSPLFRARSLVRWASRPGPGAGAVPNQRGIVAGVGSNAARVGKLIRGRVVVGSSNSRNR